MAARTLMVQGTASGVGKSMLVTALCRIFSQDGFRVAPFKSQNMALNSFVTRNGEEMGRAQVVQAEASGLEPDIDMNPILIKPEANGRAQVVVMGKPSMTVTAGDYGNHAGELLSLVGKSLARLRSACDIVVIEGAGSPAEINIKRNEIANMRIARLAGAPVLLLGDIDRGGVFASLVGTLALLDEDERDSVKGFIINKFRGDVTLLKPGLDYLESYTSKPVIGVLPYYHDILIPEEDSVYLDDRTGNKNADGILDIGVIRLPHLSNSNDFEPLQQELGVAVRYIKSAEELGLPDIIILPGSKSTVADLAFLWHSGLAEKIISLAETGVPLVGICGGFQMMGKAIKDPDGVEGGRGEVAGLGVLETVTLFQPEKTTRQVRARALCARGLLEGLEGQELTGYEIHMGQTLVNSASPLFRVINGSSDYLDGAVDDTGLVFGTYLHGLFENARFRQSFISGLRQRKGLLPVNGRAAPSKQEQYDRLAEIVRRNLNMKMVYEICGLKKTA